MKQIFHTAAFFYKEHPFNTILVVFLLILSGITEALGITAFLPFLQIVLEGGSSLDNLPAGSIQDFWSFMGLPLNYITIGAFIIISISAKSFILLIAMRKVSYVVAKVAGDLRLRLIQTLMQAQWRYFVTSILGANLNALITETDRSSKAFMTLMRFFATIIQVLVYTAAAFVVSWQIALFGIISGILICGALWFLVNTAKHTGRKQTHLSKTMLGYMADVIQAIKPMRAMALEKSYLNILNKQSIELQEASAKKIFAFHTLQISYEPAMAIMAIAGLFMMIKFGNLPASQIALMGILFIRMMMGLNKGQMQIQSYLAEESALASLLKGINTAEEQAETWELNVVSPPVIKNITFDKVFFYHGEKSVLQDINIELETKKLTALIGKSGSGKTTLIDLLCGLYKPNNGHILINKDIPLNKISIKEWREMLGFVPQDVFLFNASIRENILLGRDGYSDKDIWKALEASEIKEYIESLPEGLDSPVGEQGRMLSGGQKQRIAIARAVLHSPQILLLDEATSALDRQTEQAILTTLKKLSKNITIVMSSHHASIADFADVIFEIRQGTIEKKGLS